VEALAGIFGASKNGTIPQPQLVIVRIVSKRNPIPQLDLRPIACSPAVEVHSLPWGFQRNNHTQRLSTKTPNAQKARKLRTHLQKSPSAVFMILYIPNLNLGTIASMSTLEVPARSSTLPAYNIRPFNAPLLI